MWNNRPWIAVLLVAALACVSCLPDSLTDKQLKARIADAGGSTGDSTSSDIAVGPTCGDNQIGSSEQCDDGNAITCDGCAGCSLRTALDVTNAKSVATVTDNTVPLLLDGKTSFSYEFWFNMHKVPSSKGFAGMVAIAKPTDGGALAFAIGLLRTDNVTSTTLVQCLLARGSSQRIPGQLDGFSVVGPDPVAPNTWHHVRCMYSTQDDHLHMAVDGGLPQANKFGKLTGKPSFANGSVLFVGAVPTEKDGPTHYSGLLDEMRVATGNSAEDWQSFKPRYAPEDPGTVLLYHMDLPAGSLTLLDASANKLNADQATFAGALPTKKDTPLALVADTSCYGFQDKDLTCPPGSLPPWCK